MRLDRAIQAGEVDLEAWQAEILHQFAAEIGIHFAAGREGAVSCGSAISRDAVIGSRTPRRAYYPPRLFLARTLDQRSLGILGKNWSGALTAHALR